MNGPSTPNNREIDIVKEAQCIIDRYAVALNRISFRKQRARRKKTSEKTLWFFAGISTSAALFLALLLKIY